MIFALLQLIVKTNSKGGSFSSENLDAGRDPATQRQGFPKVTSGPSGGDVNVKVLGKEPGKEPVKERRSLINHYASQEPSSKKSKERTKSAGRGKGFLNSVFKMTRPKKSPDPSSNEESSVAFEGTFEASPQSCENVSLVNITEARRPPLTDSLSCRNSIASPISPGYESGSMSVEGNVLFMLF